MQERLRKPRKGKPWKSEGAAKFQARMVRDIYPDGRQAFKVIDTANADNRGHASIYVAEPEKGDAHTRKLRSFLLPLLQKRMSIQKAFG